MVLLPSLKFLARKVRTRGISRPSYGISDEYLCVPFTLLTIVPPCLINMQQISDTILGRWPTVTIDPEIDFITATACVS